jgi:radical SAM protein with 4Fe4S-binding SPASM domain
LNAAKLFSSYYISKTIKKPIQWGMPLSMEIEPTTSCNLRCPQCPSGLREFTRDTGMLDLELYKKIIDELHPELVWLILYFQGEPFLNKSFLEFVKYAASKNLYTATSSNAHYFTDDMAKATVESGLDRLIISIDGTNQETYSKYRKGGQLSKVTEGTENLLKWKKELGIQTPHIIWQFIAFKHNEHQIPEIKKLAKEIGVDELGIKTAQIYDYQTSNEFIPENEDLSRYSKTETGYQIKNKLLNQCWRMWRGSVITWDGLVVPCCFDKDATHRFGNISKQSFKSVWTGEQYNNFRKAILKSRKEIDICTNCTEGTKVWN